MRVFMFKNVIAAQDQKKLPERMTLEGWFRQRTWACDELDLKNNQLFKPSKPTCSHSPERQHNSPPLTSNRDYRLPLAMDIAAHKEQSWGLNQNIHTAFYTAEQTVERQVWTLRCPVSASKFSNKVLMPLWTRAQNTEEH